LAVDPEPQRQLDLEAKEGGLMDGALGVVVFICLVGWLITGIEFEAEMAKAKERCEASGGFFHRGGAKGVCLHKSAVIFSQ
jgi:maleate cis-trans isomerase